MFQRNMLPQFEIEGYAKEKTSIKQVVSCLLGMLLSPEDMFL
jgi:hypothetical protein